MTHQPVAIPVMIDDRFNSANGTAVMPPLLLGQGNWERVFVATAAIAVATSVGS